MPHKINVRCTGQSRRRGVCLSLIWDARCYAPLGNYASFCKNKQEDMKNNIVILKGYGSKGSMDALFCYVRQTRASEASSGFEGVGPKRFD